MFDTMLASTLTECQDDPKHNLSLALNSHIQVSGVASGVNTKKRKARVTPYDLAKRWNIGLETAKKTLLRTTQRGLRISPNPLLSQQYSSNDRMLRYQRLPVDLFTDTLEAGIVSHRGNKHAQGFAHTWCKAYPMTKKSDAHETLSLLFAQGGVPSTLVMDGTREQVMGEFRQKARQADGNVKQTEPYSPWQNAAEGTIRELKKSAGRKMIKTNSPKKLWDDCIELEMEIRSCTANNVLSSRLRYQGQS